MSQRDPLPSTTPAGGARQERPPQGAIQRLARGATRKVRGFTVRWDLRFRPKAELGPELRLELPPLFVGGTGRSGTTIVAKVLGAHPAYHMIPFEIRFLTDPGGLIDLVEGRTGFLGFAWRLQHRWNVAGGRSRGKRLMSPERQRAALIELRRGLGRDRGQAAVRFVHRVLDPVAQEAGAKGWIEMTPPNVQVAPSIARLWPRSKLAHAVRDGRDVACSVAPLTWGPDTPMEALRWWAESLDDAFTSCAAAPEGYVRTIRLESLLGPERDAALHELLAFAGLEVTPEVRAFFDRNVTMDKANLGRWRRDVPPAEVPAFVALHDQLAAALIAKGWPYEPYEVSAELPVAAER
jgi:hypothetical protein